MTAKKGQRALEDTALVIGATMRLTRLVVADDIGEWYVRAPIAKFIHEHTEPGLGRTRAFNYFNGLSCPFCVGFWIGAAVLVSERVTRNSRVMRGAWRFAARALTLNEVAAHAGARLGDTAD